MSLRQTAQYINFASRLFVSPFYRNQSGSKYSYVLKGFLCRETETPRNSHRSCTVKNVFFEISQNHKGKHLSRDTNKSDRS